MWKKLINNSHIAFDRKCTSQVLTLLHSERPKLYTILAFLSAIGLMLMKLGKDENCRNIVEIT